MLEETVRDFLQSRGLLPARIVVAASGGADSTALLLSLIGMDGVTVAAGHVNHHLRGDESDRDEEYVRLIAQRSGIEFHAADGTLEPEAVRRVGVEAAAREVRYRRLHEIRTRLGFALIATAHHRNDQAETVAMRLSAGRSLQGFRGVQAVRADGVIRPLLDTGRAEIDCFLAARGVTARFDRSNHDLRFLRNRVRAGLTSQHEVDSLAAVAAAAQAEWELLAARLDDAEHQHLLVEPDRTTFLRWPDQPEVARGLLHRHILRLDPDSRSVSVVSLDRLASLPLDERRVTVSREVELVRLAETVVLRRRPVSVEPFLVAVRPPGAVELPDGRRLKLEPLDHAPETPGRPPGPLHIEVPEGWIPVFEVRNRRPGDRWRPLGLHGSRKLKDFLIDRKIAAEVRDRLPLVICNGEIACIPGVEVSERFKLTGGPGTVFEVSLEGACRQ